MENAKQTISNEDLQEKDAQNLDLCFLLDCTGSMQPYIDLARDKIKVTINDIRSQYPDSAIRIAIVGHRDVKDKERFTIFEFSESVDEARSFLEGIKADGGFDIPEDMNGGFRNVLYNLKWKNFTRMLYHITDAPCHGRAYHSELDNFPKGHPEDIDWKVIFSDLILMNINYVFMKIHNRTDKMIGEFRKIYNSCPKTDLDLIFNEEVIVIQKSQPQQVKYENPVVYPAYDSSSLFLECSAGPKASITSVSSSKASSRFDCFMDFDMAPESLSRSKAPMKDMFVLEKKEMNRGFEDILSSNAMNQIASNMGYINRKNCSK